MRNNRDLKRFVWSAAFCLIGVMAVAGVCFADEPPAAQAEPVVREVTFTGADGLELKGTLLLPNIKAGERCPAALLLPGSGPTDRDGNQPPLLVTDLLKQIAEELASKGIATLRFDKRAVRSYAQYWPSEPAELNAFFGWRKFVDDAAAGLRFLQSHEAIDPERIAIIGHSEGGLIALQIAHDGRMSDQLPATLVLLATAGRPLDVVLREQMAAQLESLEIEPATRERLLEALDQAIESVKNEQKLPDDLPLQLWSLFNPTVLDVLHAYFTIDPAHLAREIRQPVLVLQGDLDKQVSVERDAPRLYEALQEREPRASELVIVNGASHNLKATTDPHDHGFTGPVNPEALRAITSWLNRHLIAAKRSQ